MAQRGATWLKKAAVSGCPGFSSNQPLATARRLPTKRINGTERHTCTEDQAQNLTMAFSILSSMALTLAKYRGASVAAARAARHRVSKVRRLLLSLRLLAASAAAGKAAVCPARSVLSTGHWIVSTEHYVLSTEHLSLSTAPIHGGLGTHQCGRPGCQAPAASQGTASRFCNATGDTAKEVCVKGFVTGYSPLAMLRPTHNNGD